LTYGYALVGFSTLTAAIITYAPRKVGYAFLVLELLLIIGAGLFSLVPEAR
jgi:NADH:ubiquinone oxidoreductase subunit 6 (subunit J)